MDYEKVISLVNQANAFIVRNHIRLVEMGPDWAATELEIGPDSLNLLGNVHGGVYFTMADAAAGAAARSRGVIYVTLNSSFDFIRGTGSGKLRAVSRVRHRGRTTCVVAVEITDGEGRLMAEGKFTMFSMGKPTE